MLRSIAACFICYRACLSEVDVKALTTKISRTAITLILVVLAFIAIFRAWAYYTKSPWTRDARFSAQMWSPLPRMLPG